MVGVNGLTYGISIVKNFHMLLGYIHITRNYGICENKLKISEKGVDIRIEIG